MKKKKINFRKEGWFYLPTTLAGWIVTFIYILACVLTFASIDRINRDLAGSLTRFLPFLLVFTLVYFWIASNSSEKEE
ncbi:MAG: hypothetical protein U0X39_16680 [Bacteroidales bacterium]